MVGKENEKGPRLSVAAHYLTMSCRSPLIQRESATQLLRKQPTETIRQGNPRYVTSNSTRSPHLVALVGSRQRLVGSTLPTVLPIDNPHHLSASAEDRAAKAYHDIAFLLEPPGDLEIAHAPALG